MTSITIVYRKDKLNKFDEAPINFRIIKDRRISYVASGIMIPLDHWDFEKNKVKTKNLNAAWINSFLANKHSEIQKEILQHETSVKSLTSRQIRDKIYGKKPTDFIAFAEDLLHEYVQAGQFGSYDKNKAILAKLKAYVGPKTITFQDITVDFLNKYERHLRENHKNKTNTVGKDFKFLRKVFNSAYKSDIIEHHLIPFTKYRIKSEKTNRQYLSEEELLQLVNCAITTGTQLEIHRDMFIFASCTGGLRVSDMILLQWKHFNGTHIDFTIQKTGSQLSIKVPDKGLDILSKYRKHESKINDFIFKQLPFDIDLLDPRQVDSCISNATARINKNLKIIGKRAGMEKKISFHTSRHTWATRALRKGISIDKVSKLMGHSAIRETQIYAKIINTELDKAMDAFNL